ncbi:FAD-dependent oxidoreductase [Lactococcus protaetiae]|uniref:FAD-dependent oxidoreductase n=1 Tax=Lactococcus protaetiae TaxID=2592653 RepID=UPI00247825C3|nr:FAD-dependent oxidoreductase [Lactococcus protaetiae]
MIVDGKFLGGDDAIMVPKTSDGRVLFCVPWHNKVILGTTDTPLTEFTLEPRPLEEEIDFILQTAGEYLEQAPTRNDVLCAYAGLRPLAARKKEQTLPKQKKSHEVINYSAMILVSSLSLVASGQLIGKWQKKPLI